MHPDATTVIDLKAFYFLEQAIPDMQRELLLAYLVVAEGTCITKHQSIGMVG